jgi:hypothetical protein
VDEIIKFLDDLLCNDLDDDGDMVLYDGVTWHERMTKALESARAHKALISELTEGIHPLIYEEILKQVGLK